MSFFRRVSDSESDSESESEEELMSSDDEGKKKQQGSAEAGTAKKPAAAPARKSAFLRSGDSDSDESSDEDESDESDGSDESDAESGNDQPAARKQSRFLRGASEDSESEEETRKVIKSARDKRVDEMDAIVRTIENAQRIDDWVAISKEFDGLNRLAERIRVVQEPMPPTYTRVMVKLEDSLNETIAREKSAEKKMKVPNARALNGMRQKLKKVLKEIDESVQRYRADPEAFEAEYQALVAPAPAPAQPKRAKKTVAGEGAADDDDDDEFQTVGRGGKAITYTSEGLFKSLTAVMEARGKKSTDRTEQIEILVKLLGVAVGTYQQVRVLLALLAARFDYNQSAAAYMNPEMWNSARNEVDQLIKVLDADRGYQVQEETKDYDDEADRQPNQEGEGPVVEVRGSLISFIERLDDEFTKCLQHVDPHTTEYVERLSDEKLLYRTITQGQNYMDAIQHTDALNRLVMRRIEHVYAKHDNIIQALEAAAAASGEQLTKTQSSISLSPTEVASSPKGPTQLIRSLCVHLYKTTGFAAERLRTRAMLCHIYHHALHRDYHVAHDMFLMSHLQDSIGMADAATQILYNRVVVQLGVCAFRVGLIRESQSALQEIFASTRVKELLAQGVSRTNIHATPEQEKLDRQRQLPFHMHINLELLECVYLVSSMLLEVPNLAHASSDTDQRRNVISRNFRKMLDFTDRQVFSGPAESTRDHIMAAAKALQNGDWKESQRLIADIKIWKLMVASDEVIQMLNGKIQEEGLRTYLFSYAHYYKSVSLRHLADMFELPLQQVRSIVSRMIWNEELTASLDMGALSSASTTNGDAIASSSSDGHIVFHGVQLTKVQTLAQQLADKANAMLEQNERTLDAKLGERSGPGDRQGGGTDREGGRAGGGEGGGRDGSRREGRRGGGPAGRGRGRGRGRAQFNALPGQQRV